MEHAGASGDWPPWSMLVRVETGHHGACWCEWRQATMEHAGVGGDWPPWSMLGGVFLVGLRRKLMVVK